MLIGIEASKNLATGGTFGCRRRVGLERHLASFLDTLRPPILKAPKKREENAVWIGHCGFKHLPRRNGAPTTNLASRGQTRKAGNIATPTCYKYGHPSIYPQ